MPERTRQAILDGLAKEQDALLKLLSRFSDEEWRALTRDDGWSVHDIAAHVADIYLATLATSGLSTRLPKATVGVTLPMSPDGRVNVERLNMLRYQVNRRLSRDEVEKRLAQAHAALLETVSALDSEQMAGPGPYGPPETMLEWFNAMILHSREHRLQLERIYALHPSA
jgi:hypothetical protein